MNLEQTVETVMRYCRNYFLNGGTFYEGQITVTNEGVSPDMNTEWVYIKGSRNNDGLHSPAYARDGESSALYPEVFSGKLYGLKIPRDFILLCKKIAEYNSANDTALPVSESFGDYSVSRGTGSSGIASWQDAFQRQLTPYQRMFTEIG